jgi:hypothetical protein
MLAIINQSHRVHLSKLPTPPVGKHNILQPLFNDSINLLGLLPQCPMRGIDLFQRQVWDLLFHGFPKMCRERWVSQCLDEKQRDFNTAVKDTELILVVNLAGTVPVD